MNEAKQKAAQRAMEAFAGGANCSEAVWQAFGTELGKDEREFGNCLAGGFGGGVSSGDLCGAIAGGVLALGLHYGRVPGEERDPRLKELCKEFYHRAETELGSVHCRNLRDLDDENWREKCSLIVAKAAELVAELLAKDKFHQVGNDYESCG
jgi:C_GCAxxG_C_C family probable redox protein